MAKCPSITAKGTQCKGLVAAGNEYCPAHDPNRAEARKQTASKGGRAKPWSTEVKDVKAELRAMVDRVQKGKMNRADASVCGQLLNILLRALSTEKELKEFEELEARMSEIEERLGNTRNPAHTGNRYGGRGWG